MVKARIAARLRRTFASRAHAGAPSRGAQLNGALVHILLCTMRVDFQMNCVCKRNRAFAQQDHICCGQQPQHSELPRLYNMWAI